MSVIRVDSRPQITANDRRPPHLKTIMAMQFHIHIS